MRYRKLSDAGDYVFGQGPEEFWINTPEAVAQAVKTRLLLPTGEWFIDLSEGMPYVPSVLGFGTQNIYDQAFQNRILGTAGLLSIVDYNSSLDNTTRKLTVTATIDTIYGQTQVSLTSPFGVPVED